MIYFPLSAALAAIAAALGADRLARRAGRGGVALAIIAPNLAWNSANQFATLHHTADNARLEQGAALDPLSSSTSGRPVPDPGPVFFAAYLFGLARGAARSRTGASSR